MKILVANLGSTSFKYRLFDMAAMKNLADMAGEKLLARGGVERIGSAQARCFVECGAHKEEATAPVSDHALAVRLCLKQLAAPRWGCLQDTSELAAIGFKAVHAQGMTGVQPVTEEVLAAMEAYNDVAPAHNPPYVRAMRLLARELPQIPLVAVFETGFHESIPAAHRYYAVPREWAEKYGIKRWGFHGASHQYIGLRTARLMCNPGARIISCHLGGSSSLCAIKAGQSLATSMGMSPQTGLPQNNRVGDFDPFALPVLMRATGKTLEQILDDLANRSGLLGLSGAGNDLRDIEAAAGRGEQDARLALDVFIASVRHYLGAYLIMLGGAEAVVFTGGIGENSPRIRAAVCAELDWFGIVLDPEANIRVKGEGRIDSKRSRMQLWIMQTNEELVVARAAKALLEEGK
jgi:acetate kinase